MTRGFWRDPDKFIETYWSRIPGVWVHGDWASVDADGFWFLHGRSDDTLNIAGKRIGPAELESAAVGHPAVREAAAIGVPHEVKGETAWIFSCLLPGAETTRPTSPRTSRPSSARRSSPTASSSSTRCRRRARRRSCGAPCKATALGADPGDLSSLENPESLDAIEAAVALSARTRHRRRPRHRREHRARARRRTAGRSSSPRARATQIDAVAAEIGGRALELDVSSREAVERVVRRGGDVDLLVANAGIAGSIGPSWEQPRRLVADVRGERARRAPLLPRGDPAMLERGVGRIVITGSGASYLPGATTTAYSASKAAVCRYGETLNNAARGDPGLLFSPGLVRTEMTASFPRRRAVDAARARARARAQARDRPLRRARRPLPARRARRRRRSARAHRRDPRARPERDPPAAMKTLVCFGDSNTWGYVPGSRRRALPARERWPCILQRLLGDDWEVIAEGLGGRTATIDRPDAEGRNGLPYLLPCLHSHAPVDVVVVFLGTNDVNFLADDRIARCIARLVDIVRAVRRRAARRVPATLRRARPRGVVPAGARLRRDRLAPRPYPRRERRRRAPRRCGSRAALARAVFDRL